MSQLLAALTALHGRKENGHLRRKDVIAGPFWTLLTAEGSAGVRSASSPATVDDGEAERDDQRSAPGSDPLRRWRG